ncbi:MAG: hypothetical protein CMJ83_19060 [Planctomycetes bacterium]|nr:hypothetical protein [Planctomycetota bacterium]
MISFAAAFLTCLLAQLLPGLGTGVAAIAVVTVAVVRGVLLQRPDIVAATVAGVALALVRGAPDPSASTSAALAPGPRSLQVTIEGSVSRVLETERGPPLVVLSDGMQLTIPRSEDPLWPGTRIRVRGRLEARGRRVRVTSADSMVVLQRPSDWRPEVLCEQVRRAARQRLAQIRDPETRACLTALVLGDRLPRPLQERLAETGTLHLFAVSGLHLALLLSMLRPWVGVRARLLLPPLLLYAAVSGLRTPVARALVLVSGALGARALRRPQRPLAQLLFAATLIGVWRPTDLLGAGFLLSFSAYAGILLIGVPLLDRNRKDPLRALTLLRPGAALMERVREILVISVVATAASLPVTIMLFHRATPGALIASVLLTPVLPALLGLALLLTIVPAFPPFVIAAEALVAALRTVVTGLEHLPGASMDVARPHPIAVALSCVALVALAWRASHGQATLALTPWLIAAGLALLVPAPPADGFHLLPAGRGAAALLVLPHGRVLVDAGPRSARVADRLLGAGAREIDLLVVTHGHDDHAGGVARVHRRLTVHRTARRLVRGCRVHPDIDVLWPLPSAAMLDDNDHSRVVVGSTLTHRILIPGDLEGTGLSALLERGDPPSCDVLVLPHHGARNDRLVDLLLRTLPDRAWLPARAGFPDEGSALVVAWAGVPVTATWAAADEAWVVRDP